MPAIHALAAANREIFLIKTKHLPFKAAGSAVSAPKNDATLQTDGIWLTMADNRTDFAKEITALLQKLRK